MKMIVSFAALARLVFLTLVVGVAIGAVLTTVSTAGTRTGDAAARQEMSTSCPVYGPATDHPTKVTQ